MSGIRRAINAENASKGKTGMEALAAFSPENMRAETGRSIHSKAAKNADRGEYLGKNGKDATPGK